jgi:hypothetical protein
MFILKNILELFGLTAKKFKYYVVIDNYENKIYSIDNHNFSFLLKYNDNVAYKLFEIEDNYPTNDAIKFKMLIAFDNISDFNKILKKINKKSIDKIFYMIDKNDKLYEKLIDNIENYL